MIRTEGSHLCKLDSLRYFISVRAIPTLILSINRTMLLWDPEEGSGLQSDDLFWYLPTRESDGRLTMPLAKVMRWTYQVSGVSQKQFHCPGKFSDPVDPALQQNLENAINWTRGKTLPSLLALVRNFETSFAVQSRYERSVDLDIQKSILTALVYARVGTFIAREIEQAFGSAYLDDVCLQIRELAAFLQEEVLEFKAEITPIMHAKPTADDAQWVWIKACVHHDSFVKNKISQVWRTLGELYAASPSEPFKPEVLNALVRKYGKFSVYLNTDRWGRQAEFSMHNVFRELLDIGFQLKKKSDMTWEEISEFEARVIKEGQQETLSWFAPWLRGIYHYRKEDYATAFLFYEIAFEQGKYRAGSLQYDLVNQFIEIAAKNDKEVPFKKGIEWASYIGVPIRWLREKERTEENLKFVRYVMKRASYAH